MPTNVEISPQLDPESGGTSAESAPSPAGNEGNGRNASPAGPAASDNAASDPTTAPDPAIASSGRTVSARQLAVNRANAQKSTGPRTPEGKERSKMNAFKYCSVRLLGAAEYKTVRMIPGEAEKLFQRLMEPYEPVPPMLALHFQDLARLHLELEAWERIRDAYLEHRGQQTELEKHRRLEETERDLPSFTPEARALYHLPDSPGKFRAIADNLMLIDNQFRRRKIDSDTDVLLRFVYGPDFKSDHQHGQEICVLWQRLISGKRRATKNEIKRLRVLVQVERAQAELDYQLRLNEKSMTPCACMAGLEASTLEEQRMNRHGQALREAIDRKQNVINRLLRVLGLASPEVRSRRGANAGKIPQKNRRANPLTVMESINVAEK